MDETKPAPPVLTYPNFDKVPLENTAPDFAHTKYRRDLFEAAAGDEGYQRALTRMCREDSLFWLSSFCFVFEPRPVPKVLPFIPWVHQVPAWKETEKWLGYEDIGWEKSRAEGASWLATMLILHKWLFVPMFAAGLVSKDERSADDPDNPDSLFWKLDWQINHLPNWMVPRFRRSKTNHTLTNLDTLATITGYAATGDVASGGRKTVFVMDELAKFARGPDKEALSSTQPITNCRLFISTPKGSEGAYFDVMHKDSNIKHIVLDWKQNPTRNVGMYRVLIARDNSRKVVLEDKKFWLKLARLNGNAWATENDLEELASRITKTDEQNPFGYEFMVDGPFVFHEKQRSPWYDNECNRPGATPQSIAQEYDRDYGGSQSRFFDINLLKRLQSTMTDPIVRGEMSMPPHPEGHGELVRCPFQQQSHGRLHLWFKPDIHGRPPRSRRYYVGIDIAAGTGGVKSSNSVLSVINSITHKQVAEFATPLMPPYQLAEYATALCYWFNGEAGPAIQIWEANGIGVQYSLRVAELGYPFIYYRGTQEELIEKETKKLGWWSNNKNKAALLGELARALEMGELEASSSVTMDDAKSYMNRPGGKIEHIAATTEDDPAGAGERHGDRVIALALAWWLSKSYTSNSESGGGKETYVPPNSVLGRRQKREKEKHKQSLWLPKSSRRLQVSHRR